MPRTPISALAGGTLLTLTTSPQAVLPLVAPQAQVQVTVTQHGNLTPLTVYSDESSAAVLTQPVLTTINGTLPGWLDISGLASTGADLQVALPGGTETIELVAPGLIGGGTLTKAAIIATGLAASDIGADAAGAAAAEQTRAQTAEALKAPIASPTFTGVPAAPALSISGLTGATAGGRYVGTTASGAPTSGTFALGDWCTDQAGKRWTCISAGSPGTWAQEPGTGGGGANITSPDSSITVGGTPTNPTVVAGPSMLNLSSFLGFSQVVRPSGDATGATDATNINAALAGSASSVYLNGSYTVNATISIPSNKTLILADATILLAAAANVPIIANPSFTSSTTPLAINFHIKGFGRAVLDYNGANQTEQSPAFWNSSIITLINCSNFSVENIQFQNSTFMYLFMQACSDGRIMDLHGVHGSTDKGFLHTDIGCTNLLIDGITASGTFSDSVVSLNSVSITAGAPTPYAATLTGAARNISGISFTNFKLASSTGMFCFYIDASATVGDIDISNIHNTYTGAATGEEIQLGPAGYAGATLPAQGSMYGIRVKGYTFGGTNHTFVTFDSPLTDLQVSNVRANGSVFGLAGNFGAVAAGLYPQATRVKFSDINLPGIVGAGAMCKFIAGWNVTDLEFSNVLIGTASGPLLANASDITGLKLNDVHVNTLSANPFQSTGNEVGVIRNFTADAKGSALTAVLPVLTGMRIEQPFPALASADVTPMPVHGSEILAYNTKDPTGGAGTTGGRYSADGKAWNLVSSGNGVFRPGQIYQPLLFHYDAAVLKSLSNGASVTRWPDAAQNVALAQATGANQPTFVTSDATLNNLPAVAFNGTSQYLQNTLLTPVAQATPFMLFMVYYWTTFAGYALETAVSGATTLHYAKSTSTATSIGYTSNVTETHTSIATNTAYVAAFGANGSTGYVGENCAALSSLTSGSIGAGASMSGLTLGAHNTPSVYAAIHVAELFAYAGIPSSSDYATIAAGLAAKYAITLV